MNEEEKSYLPALRAVLSEVGRTERDVNVEHLCGEAWRHHVLVTGAEEFFKSVLSGQFASSSAYRGPPPTLYHEPVTPVLVLEPPPKVEESQRQEVPAPESPKVFKLRRKR